MAPLIWDGWPGSTLPASLIGLAVSAGCQVGFLGPLPHGLLVSSWPGRLPYTLSEGKDAKLLTAFPQRSHSITSTNFYWSKEVRGPRYGWEEIHATLWWEDWQSAGQGAASGTRGSFVAIFRNKLYIHTVMKNNLEKRHSFIHFFTHPFNKEFSSAYGGKAITLVALETEGATRQN